MQSHRVAAERTAAVVLAQALDELLIGDASNDSNKQGPFVYHYHYDLSEFVSALSYNIRELVVEGLASSFHSLLCRATHYS